MESSLNRVQDGLKYTFNSLSFQKNPLGILNLRHSKIQDSAIALNIPLHDLREQMTYFTLILQVYKNFQTRKSFPVVEETVS